jgi:hypothetical protein
MPRVSIDSLTDDARIWVFGISPALGFDDTQTFVRHIDKFLDGWAAHGAPITSARQMIEGSFLVVAVDHASETSGCSIDKMFGLLKELEQQLHVAVLESNRIFVRHGDGHVDALTRAAFRENADQHTIVFDTLVERLGEVRNGSWERKAEESWHRDLLSSQTA